jgi:hypothetical protein
MFSAVCWWISKALSTLAEINGFGVQTEINLDAVLMLISQ